MLPPRPMTLADILAVGAMPADLTRLAAGTQADVIWQLREAVGWPKYWGTSDSPTLDAAGVKGLQNVDKFSTNLRIAVQMDRPGGAAQYFYYAYPRRFGGFEWIYCGTTTWTSITPVMSDVDIALEGGIVIPYAVCRSPAKIAGSILFKIS